MPSTSYDQELIELLAAHASIAITNARLYERSRELSILSERNRLALELHDVVSQKLFSVDAQRRGRGHASSDRDTDAARAQLERAARAGARGARRAALADPRAAARGARQGRARGRAAQGGRDARPRARRSTSSCRSTAPARRSATAIGRRRRARARGAADRARGAAQRGPPRGRAERVAVRARPARGQTLRLEVADDGVGFDPEDPELRSRHLGLTSMEERARELGGTLSDALDARRRHHGHASRCRGGEDRLRSGS